MQRRLLRYALDRLPGLGHKGGFQGIEALAHFAVTGGRMIGRRLTLAGEVTAEWHRDAVLLWKAGDAAGSHHVPDPAGPRIRHPSKASCCPSVPRPSRSVRSGEAWRDRVGPLPVPRRLRRR